jgi:putative transposase
LSIDGTLYEVEPDMAGEVVTLMWGLFDDELYVEYDARRSGPYRPISGPIPLHRYRAFKRGKVAETADRIRALAEQLQLPISALAGNDVRMADAASAPIPVPTQPFELGAHDDDFSSTVAAKLAIPDDMAVPLAKLSVEDRGFIDEVLTQTLSRGIVFARIRDYFRHKRSGEEHHAR